MDAAELLLLLLLMAAVAVAVAGAPFWPLLAGLPDGDPNESLLKNISRLLCKVSVLWSGVDVPLVVAAAGCPSNKRCLCAKRSKLDNR